MIRAVLDPLRKSLSPRVSVTMHHPRAVGFWKHCVWIAAVTIVRTHCSSADNLVNMGFMNIRAECDGRVLVC